jgi:hypothetical protein
MKNKKLVIITGITGAIGNAFLAKYSRDENTVVYGISRKAEDMNEFVNIETGKFFPSTFICDIGSLRQEKILEFVNKINFEIFESVTYIHLLGLYPFEVDKFGKFSVENDKDGDGINDTVLELSYRVFKFFNDGIIKKTEVSNTSFSSITFGSLADEHKPLVHQSWWRVMEMTKEYMKKLSKNHGMHLIKISSVTCTHEIITRPHVFIQTDADMNYWVLPHEITDRFFAKIEENKIDLFSRFHEYEIYNKKPGFDSEYYENFKFTPRKTKEIYHN